jgi:hypothetical protein
MAYLDTADLLARCKRILNRPSTDAAIADADWYAFMTDAQDRAFHDLAPRVPDAMYGAPVALGTSDSGATYTFASTVFPIGHVRIYPTRSAIPDSPLVEGVDYLHEGDAIRIPNGRTRTFSDGGPWARWITPPGVIDGSTPATLIAPALRLVVYGAVSLGAERLQRDITPYETLYERTLSAVILSLRTAVGPRDNGGGGGVRRVTRSGGVVP